MISSKNKTIDLLLSLTCIAYLLFFHKYATGYKFERFSIFDSAQMGYKMENGEWMFGYAVPFLVGWLIWTTKDTYKSISTQKLNWLGGLLLFIGFFLFFGGYKANQKYVGYFSMHLIFAGVAIWHFGVTHFLKRIWLWFLLGMMWPWIFLIDVVSFPLQKLMTYCTSLVLTLVGEDFIKDGTSIMSSPTETMEAGERFSLKVAAACSGLRSFFALAMISLFYGFLTLKKDLNRFILLICSCLFTVAGNVVRMMLLYVGTLIAGKEFAIGKGEHAPSAYHLLAGIAVFVVALVGMVTLSSFMEKKDAKKFRVKKTIKS